MAGGESAKDLTKNPSYQNSYDKLLPQKIPHRRRDVLF